MKFDYDFIKSEEAKEIYLKLEKRRMFKEYSGWDDPHLDKFFIFEDEEKKKMVERFVLEAKVPYQGFETVEKFEKGSLEMDLGRFKNLLNSITQLKEDLDPDYVYDKWLVEYRKLEHEYIYLQHNGTNLSELLTGRVDLYQTEEDYAKLEEDEWSEVRYRLAHKDLDF